VARLPYSRGRAVAVLRERDPILAGLIDRVGPFTLTLSERSSPFHALMASITSQQLSGRAAATIFARLSALFADPTQPTPAALLALPEEALRGAGLSRAKAAALRDLAAKTLDGVVPDRDGLAGLDDRTIIDRLTIVRGIGQWTVEMLLIFYLGRPDVLPVDDLGVRKGFALTYRKRKLPDPKALARLGELWAPYRSVASWYFWRALDLQGARAP
jgi:3-methyladenine DNA glycosylase/8-oxoguanine DNA glycosylase